MIYIYYGIGIFVFWTVSLCVLSILCLILIHSLLYLLFILNKLTRIVSYLKFCAGGMRIYGYKPNLKFFWKIFYSFITQKEISKFDNKSTIFGFWSYGGNSIYLEKDIMEKEYSRNFILFKKCCKLQKLNKKGEI